jgi:hypothetical protein
MQRAQTLQTYAPHMWRIAIAFAVFVLGYLIVSALGFFVFSYEIRAGN